MCHPTISIQVYQVVHRVFLLLSWSIHNSCVHIERHGGKRSVWTNAKCVCLFDSEGSGLAKFRHPKYFPGFSEINFELPAGETGLFYSLSQYLPLHLHVEVLSAP